PRRGRVRDPAGRGRNRRANETVNERVNEPYANSRSERQAALAGGGGEGRDAAVIDVAAAVEHDFLDAGLYGALGDQLADLGGGVPVGAGLELAFQALVERRGGGQRQALQVVDD